jgi:hypothetical protein
MRTQNIKMRPFQGRNVLSRLTGAAQTRVSLAPGYYVHPLRG